ncbi:MAG: hypothetical protein AAFU79_14835, partial [Myxococcota bacterium]
MRGTVLLFALGAVACSNPRDRLPVGPPLPPPEQKPTARPPFHRAEVTFTPRAEYALDGYALITDQPRDEWSDVSPYDVTFGWGPMSTRALAAPLRFHLARRYVSVRWGADFPLGSRSVMESLSNHHLIPQSPEIAAQLESIRAGDRVRIRGLLVNVEAPGRPPLRTSLSRTDKGSGACEVLFVEAV